MHRTTERLHRQDVNANALPSKLRVHEAAQLRRCHERTIRRHAADGAFKVSRPGGGALLIDTASFLRWLDGGEASAA